jgi:hypothetical protein
MYVQAWFAQELSGLKTKSNDPLLSPTSTTSPNGLESLASATPFSPSVPALPLSSNDGILQLPLSREMSL